VPWWICDRRVQLGGVVIYADDSDHFSNGSALLEDGVFVFYGGQPAAGGGLRGLAVDMAAAARARGVHPLLLALASGMTGCDMCKGLDGMGETGAEAVILEINTWFTGQDAWLAAHPPPDLAGFDLDAWFERVLQLACVERRTELDGGVPAAKRLPRLGAPDYQELVGDILTGARGLMQRLPARVQGDAVLRGQVFAGDARGAPYYDHPLPPEERDLRGRLSAQVDEGRDLRRVFDAQGQLVRLTCVLLEELNSKHISLFTLHFTQKTFAALPRSTSYLRCYAARKDDSMWRSVASDLGHCFSEAATTHRYARSPCGDGGGGGGAAAVRALLLSMAGTGASHTSPPPRHPLLQHSSP
jgi:hypothetical protein